MFAFIAAAVAAAVAVLLGMAPLAPLFALAAAMTVRANLAAPAAVPVFA